MASRETWSARRINYIFDAVPGMRRYLEVGVRKGATFEHVRFPERVAVDPLPLFDLSRLPRGVEVHAVTSDAYFAGLSPERRFDMVFLDGLNTYEQTYADLCNALRHCRDGAILIDDVVPSDEVSAMRDQDESYAVRGRSGLSGSPWHGDVFRTVVCVIDHHPELEFVTLTDRGNPQLLLWKREPDAEVVSISQAALDRYLALEFSEVFRDGVPASFNPTDEHTGLAKAAEAVRRHRHPRS